jgi:hypothetical protein
MAARSAKRLQRTLNKAPGREKGLLVANDRAHLEVHLTELITFDEVQDLRRSIVSEEESRSYNKMIYVARVMSFHISNTKASYLQLRELLANIRALFLLFKQHVFIEIFLNMLSWRTAKDNQALYDYKLGRADWPCLFGVFGLRDVDGRSFVNIAVAEQGKTLARELISSATELMVIVKTSIEGAREFMKANDAHLTAFEDLMSEWEEDLRERVRTVKLLLLPGDIERWEGVAETANNGDQQEIQDFAALVDFCAQSAEKHLEFVTALPEYESVSVDEASLDKLLESMTDVLNTL